MKTHYEVLGVPPDAPPEEIKRAFRHEIARYHPDKVQHLGQEFQDMAAARAAELTEAYRVLRNLAARAAYDGQLASGTAAPSTPPVTAPPSPAPAAPGGSSVAPEPEPAVTVPDGSYRTFQRERQSGDHFVRRESLRRVRDVVIDLFTSALPLGADGFELSWECKVQRGVFKKTEPDLRVLVRYGPLVDAALIHETWPLAQRASAGFDHPVCVFLIGPSLAARTELASAISRERRRAKSAHVVIVPVDVHDWEPLMPANAPTPVRTMVERLKREA